jgi:hypothetical protein
MLQSENFETTQLYVMHCTVSYWILEEHGDREWVLMGAGKNSG